MAGIVSSLQALTNIVTTLVDSNTTDSKELGKLILKNVKDSALIRTDGSITKLLSRYVIEPVIIATKGTKETEVIDKILEVNTDMFSSFYLQAFEILTSINGLTPVITIDLLSSDSGGITRFALSGTDKLLSMESLTDNTYIGQLLSDKSIGLSIEADDKKAKEKKDSSISADDRFNNVDKSPLHKILQRNLTVTVAASGNNKAGDLFNHTVSIPITIKAHVIYTTIDNVLNMLAPNASDKSFTVRLDDYRSGAISLSDLIFATDLIKKYKDNKIKDKEDIINITNNRIVSAHSKILDSKAVGFEKNYNMLVVTSEDKIRLDKHVRGDVNNEKYKQDLLEQANALTLTIIDQDYERCYILTRDIRGRTDITFKTLMNRKDKGVDITELMKAMSLNRPPVF